MALRAISNKVTFRVPTFVPFCLSFQGFGVRNLWNARHQFFCYDHTELIVAAAGEADTRRTQILYIRQE